MQVFEQLIPKGHPNRPGTKLEALKGIAIHYTANFNPGATDTANAKYFARKWSTVGPECKAMESDGYTPFRYGSAHIIIDEDSATTCIPFDEVAWHVGDRPLPWTPSLKGQKPLAASLFGNRQNYQTIGVEIACNGDWEKAVHNAIQWVRGFCAGKGLRPVARDPLYRGEVILLRHFDLTGKICPKPMVDDPKAWDRFIVGVCQ